MVGVPCSEREHTVPLPCTKQHHSPVYAELRCCVINTFFNNICPPYKAWERRGGVTPSPPPKPPRQRRRTAQTEARRRGNRLAERGRGDYPAPGLVGRYQPLSCQWTRACRGGNRKLRNLRLNIWKGFQNFFYLFFSLFIKFCIYNFQKFQLFFPS